MDWVVEAVEACEVMETQIHLLTSQWLLEEVDRATLVCNSAGYDLLQRHHAERPHKNPE